jgi:hypothetical protein
MCVHTISVKLQQFQLLEITTKKQYGPGTHTMQMHSAASISPDPALRCRSTTSLLNSMHACASCRVVKPHPTAVTVCAIQSTILAHWQCVNQVTGLIYLIIIDHQSVALIQTAHQTISSICILALSWVLLQFIDFTALQLKQWQVPSGILAQEQESASQICIVCCCSSKASTTVHCMKRFRYAVIG